MFISCLALQAAAIECVPGRSSESSICKELSREAPASLELLQHSQHSVGKAKHAEHSHIEQAMETDDMLEVERNSGEEGAELKSKEDPEQQARGRAATQREKKVAQGMAETLASLTQVNKNTNQKAIEKVEADFGTAVKEEPDQKANAEAKLVGGQAGKGSQGAMGTSYTDHAKQTAGKEAAAQKGEATLTATQKTKEKADLKGGQLPDIIWDWVPDTVHEIVDKVINTGVGSLASLINNTMNSLDGYIDDLSARCSVFQDSVIKEVSTRAAEGIDAGIQALQNVVVRDVQPIQEQWYKIVQLLQQDGQRMVSVLEELGLNGTFAVSEASYTRATELAINISAALNESTSIVALLLSNITMEEKKNILAQVEPRAAEDMERVTAFKEDFITSMEDLIIGLADQLGIRLLPLNETELSPTISSTLQFLLDRARSLVQDITDAFSTLFGSTSKAALVILEPEPENSAAAGLGAQLGLSLTVAWVGAFWL